MWSANQRPLMGGHWRVVREPPCTICRCHSHYRVSGLHHVCAHRPVRAPHIIQPIAPLFTPMPRFCPPLVHQKEYACHAVDVRVTLISISLSMTRSTSSLHCCDQPIIHCNLLFVYLCGNL